jgi:DNA replication protein DnaC
VLQTAKVQRWAPEEVLRTLIEAEVAARDASNQRNRLRGAGFPVAKTLEEFKVAVSSLPQATFDGVADNSVGRVIDTLLRHDLVIVDEVGFAPLDDTGTQLLFRFVAATYERRALGIASHWPFEQWGRFLPDHVTATSMLDRLLHHATVVVTEGESFRVREARTRTTRS